MYIKVSNCKCFPSKVPKNAYLFEMFCHIKRNIPKAFGFLESGFFETNSVICQKN